MSAEPIITEPAKAYGCIVCGGEGVVSGHQRGDGDELHACCIACDGTGRLEIGAWLYFTGHRGLGLAALGDDLGLVEVYATPEGSRLEVFSVDAFGRRRMLSLNAGDPELANDEVLFGSLETVRHLERDRCVTHVGSRHIGLLELHITRVNL